MNRNDQLTTLGQVSDPACWYPQFFAETNKWQYELSDRDIGSLRTLAISIRKQVGNNPNALLSLPIEDLDLAGFVKTLANVFKELRDGLGAVLITGLPIHEMDLLDVAIIYWAIGKHLGTACPNNPEGDMFGHITDLGKTQSDPHSRGYQTREAMDYHCDQCDIVGLLCIREAKQGGISKLTSSVAMYNTLLKEDPRLVEVLCEPFYWTKHGEHAAGELPYYKSPVFNFLEGKLCTSFGPKHIYKGHELPDTPTLTAEQKMAIQRAEEIADELHFAMELKPGDMQFVNNYVSLHTRSSFIDHDDPARKRLLWRLWLMNDSVRCRTDYAKQWARGVSTGNSRAQIRLQ